MSTFTNAKTAISFHEGTYPLPDGQERAFEQVDLKSCIISVSQAKKIIRTEVEGKDGTVKEFNCMDDYNVTITGVITGESGVYPVVEVLKIKNMLNANVPIDVSCEHLQNLDIFTIVIYSFDLHQDIGGVSYQSFTINAYSETPTELRITGV